MVAMGFALAAGLACLLALGSRLTALFLVLLSGLLFGYLLFGRAFAYLGVYPIFVGEAVLALAVLHLVVSGPHVRLTWLHWLLLAFLSLGLLRTVPYIESDGIDALRDGALWGYGLFAIALSAAVREQHFGRIAALYAVAMPLFLIWIPIANLLVLYGGDLPTLLGSNVSIVSLKLGDVGVHLGGIAAFLIVGFGRGRLVGRVAEISIWAAWLASFIIVGSGNRGGMLAAGAAAAAALVLMRPTRRFVARFAMAATLMLAVAALAPAITLTTGRSLALSQIAENISSIVTDSGAEKLEGSKAWRTAWWNDIVNYTFNGPYFWTGKGFGINLADEDGFQTVGEGEAPLRSPHSAHLTVLARMGVPGLVMWISLQVAFGASLLWSFLRARRHGATFWSRVDAWLLCYWLAMIVNASFDVYFEGPQGGIWFWTIVGLGLSAILIQRPLFKEAQSTPQVVGLSSGGA
jgi:hypothetical protein